MSKRKTTANRRRGVRNAKRPPARSSSTIDLSLLEQLVALMAANDLSTVEMHEGDRHVVLKRGAPAASSPVAPAGAPAPPPAAVSTTASDEGSLTPINSPMVGTFYAAPSPDSPPFVTVGSAVDEDTDVCVIEAMKVFNNIKAECRGAIHKILVQNGQAVEFGQTLFLVKPG